MSAVIDPAEALRVDVAVHLCRRERGVAEQLLDRSHVSAALQQVRREGVTQAMRVGDEPSQSRRVEATAARRKEERVFGSCSERRRA